MNKRIGFISLAFLLFVCSSSVFSEDMFYLSTNYHPNPCSLYKVDLSGNSTWLLDFTVGIKDYHAIAASVDGTYLIAFERTWSIGDNRAVVMVDLTTVPPTEIHIGNLPDNFMYPNYVGQAAYSPDGTLYFTSDRSDQLWTLVIPAGPYPTPLSPTLKGTVTDGAITIPIQGADIAFDNSGTLYMLNNPTGWLGTVNTSTAVATHIGYLNDGVNTYGSNTGMSFTPDGRLFVSNNTTDSLLEVNPADASVIDIVPLTTGSTPVTVDVRGGDMGRAVWSLCEPHVTTLWAGAGQNDTTKGTNVGTVTVSIEGNSLCVTYDILNADCYLTEVHLYIGKDFPESAAPGKFPYKEVFIDNTTKSFAFPPIPLLDFDAACGDTLYIAAHAKVCCGDIDVQCETAWGFGPYSFSYLELTKKWGWVIEYDICCPY